MPQPKNAPPAEPAPEPTPEPAAPASAEPSVLDDIKRLLEELPGKLKATITDDDRRSISEYVHELFERSGAFEKPEPQGEGEGGETPGDGSPEDKPEPAPEPTPGGDSWARRTFGQY